MALVSRLPAGLAAARSSLVTRDRWRIARRWLARIARRRAELLLQLLDPLERRFEPRLQPGDALDVTRVTRHVSGLPEVTPNGKRDRVAAPRWISHSREWTYRPPRGVNGYFAYRDWWCLHNRCTFDLRQVRDLVANNALLAPEAVARPPSTCGAMTQVGRLGRWARDLFRR